MVTTPARPSSTAGRTTARPSAPRRRVSPARRFMSRLEGGNGPATRSSYYLIIGTTLALTCIGLMTVLSASAAESISLGEDPYQLFLREGMFAAGGLVLMFALSFASRRLLMKMAWPALGLATFLLLLVFTPLGKAVGGNRNWIELGSFSFQPSEAAKLALALWMGLVLSRKGDLIRNWKHAVVPVVPLGGIVVGLILGGHDLGTSVIVMAVIAAGLYFAGVSMKLLAPAAAGGLALAALLAALSGNRTSRLAGWLGACDPTQGLCDQARNGLYALASGGWWGVGLGQSRQKWSWIPEAHNDFIFAIIGEEFGLLGTLIIVALYGILAVAIFRVIVRHDDPFARIVCGSILVWIIGQAFVNIAMVTGLLPVIGVPLPLISYGGSALVVVLGALGIVLSFARTQPSRPALTAGPIESRRPAP